MQTRFAFFYFLFSTDDIQIIHPDGFDLLIGKFDFVVSGCAVQANHHTTLNCKYVMFSNYLSFNHPPPSTLQFIRMQRIRINQISSMVIHWQPVVAVEIVALYERVSLNAPICWITLSYYIHFIFHLFGSIVLVKLSKLQCSSTFFFSPTIFPLATYLCTKSTGYGWPGK